LKKMTQSVSEECAVSSGSTSPHTKAQSVKVISYTPDAESVILRIARVSSDQSNESTGLLRYLIRNRHWSPFEHGFLTLEFSTSRAIAAQLLRHRSFTFQEFSQRYASPTEFELYEGRLQAETNRQSSVEGVGDEDQDWWRNVQQVTAANGFQFYIEALNRGFAKECARFILPMSTSTKLYMSGTLRSWIHYLEERTNEHTQLEHRVLAQEAKEHFVNLYPVISEALGWTVS
jgi:thymidylate synthase (FAD)